MSTYNSKNAKATIGTDTILYVTDLSLAGIGKEFEDYKTFGEDYYDAADVGYAPVTGSMTYLMDLADTTGQNTIEDACISGTLITTFRVYVTATDYWTSDTGTDADAGVYFTNYTPLPSIGTVTKASVDFKFIRAYHRTS